MSDPEEQRIPDEGDRRLSPEHRLHRTARSARREPPAHPPWYRGRVGRDLAILVLAAVVGLAVFPFADTPNLEYPEARAVADRLDSAWKSIVNERADPDETATAAGLHIHRFEMGGRSVMVLTTSTPTNGLCYAFRFGGGILSEAGILDEPTSGCTPHPPGVFQRGGSWSDVLPAERITAPWFIPLMVLLSAAGLFALTDISILFLTKRGS